MGKIYFTSDLHYNHKNICLGESNWDNKEENCRPYNSVGEMNDAIVDSINSIVKEDDVLYCLGDWSFGPSNNIYELRRRLKCKSIHLVLGNHDKGIKNYSDGFIVDNLFKSVNSYLTLKFGKKTIVLSHYPMELWEKAEYGSIHLHGHVHHSWDNNSINVYFKRVDVGWTPEHPVYSYEEIMDMTANRLTIPFSR